MDVEAPPNAAERMNRPLLLRRILSRQDTKDHAFRCKAICFMFWFGFAYFVGRIILWIIFIVVNLVTMSATHVDIGVWCVLWFLVCQAWAVALAWLIYMWTARRRATCVGAIDDRTEIKC